MPHKFHVLGVPVFTRSLPSGDMVVWHPYNSAVREVIEPICRERGYWRPGYNNWIIHACHCESVLGKLALMEDAS
jgi:hypothetical protein